jgi:hypothetical protein
MRLHPAELSAIRTTLGTLDSLGRIYLYGSRTDDADMPIHQIARQGIPL